MSKMFMTNGITLVCLIYTVLILVLFFMKNKVNKVSNKVFMWLLFTTIIVMLTNLIWGYVVSNELSFSLIMTRILSFVIGCWNYMLIYYISIVFKDDEVTRKFYKEHNIISYVLGAIIVVSNLLFCVLLPVNAISPNDMSGYILDGPLSIYLDILGFAAILCAIINISANLKKIDAVTKVLSVITILICGSILSLSFTNFVFINEISFLHTAVLMFLYLSLESQDASLLASFNESSKKAKESNELKSEFIMNMSHQLRTPMNTILGFSESLLTDENATLEMVKEDSKNIKLASRRLLELINSILDISKLESDKEVVNNRDYNLDTVIYDLSSNINSKIDKENLMFTINANENCPNNLNGDDYKLSKVLNIFLTNAVNYTNYGEVSINISSKQIDNDNHEFTFHIKNTGHAMKTENFERSFEDLIKLNTNSNNDIDADTLKIIVAKELLNKLNGTVEFINETGQGTQYIVKLTQKVTSPGELGNIREKIQTVHEETYQKVDLQGKKVLIVDDGKVNSIVLERLLKPYNLEIKTTSNPRDGVDKVTYEDYDMIFVNDQMEDMTGKEFINKLQSTGNRLPPIVGMILNIDILDKTHKYDNILYCPIEYRELTKIIKNNKWD